MPKVGTKKLHNARTRGDACCEIFLSTLKIRAIQKTHKISKSSSKKTEEYTPRFLKIAHSKEGDAVKRFFY